MGTLYSFNTKQLHALYEWWNIMGSFLYWLLYDANGIMEWFFFRFPVASISYSVSFLKAACVIFRLLH